MATSQPLILTAAQRDEFDQTGALVLPGYFPAHDMAAMADAVWADLLKRFGIDRRRPQTWTTERPGKFQSIARAGAFKAFASPRLMAIGDAFLGAGQWMPPRAPERGGLPMVTFNAGHAWEAPHRLGHLDQSASMSVGRLPCIRVFAFLEPSRPRGGGTCYVAGSHRLAIAVAARTPEKHLHTPDVLAAFRAEHPWFDALFSPGGDDRVRRFMTEGAVCDDVPVRVREMTGEVGDVVLLHPATLHCAAVNERPTPRMMLMAILGQPGPNVGM